jgi:hypothetical protein
MTPFSNNSPPYADSPSASVVQSILNRAANFPVSGKECGALPRRRYARKVLKSSPGCRGRARKTESRLPIGPIGEASKGSAIVEHDCLFK